MANRLTGPPAIGWRFVGAVLLVVCFAVLSPFLPNGVHWSDSYAYNTLWIREFGAALARGELSPRWIPTAFAGLGASSFYFYPPLAFYVAAGVDAVSFGALSTDQLTAWTAYVLLVASGAAMYLWLRDQTTAGWALLGAVLFVCSPYHLITLWLRGAFAEFSAYAVLPLFALALRRAAFDPRWVAPAALSYGLLICAHVGTALLTTLTLVPVYVGFLVLQAPATQRLEVVVRCGLAGVLGLLLAAFYLAPALFMQQSARMHAMWTVDSPTAWLLLRPDLWRTRPFADAMALVGWGLGGGAAAALVALCGCKSSPTASGARVAAVAALTGLGLYAAQGLWTWSVTRGLLGAVQYPWRVLPIMELTAITALVLAISTSRRLLALVLAPLLAWPLPKAVSLLKPAFLYNTSPASVPAWAQANIALRVAPPEHLPAAYPFKNSQLRPMLWRLHGAPLAETIGGRASIVASSSFADGSVAVAIDAAEPTRVVVRRFHFAAWRVRQVEPVKGRPFAPEPFGPAQRLSFVAPPGRATYRIHVVRTPLERAGDAVSLATAAGCLAYVVGGWRRRRRRNADMRPPDSSPSLGETPSQLSPTSKWSVITCGFAVLPPGGGL